MVFPRPTIFSHIHGLDAVQDDHILYLVHVVLNPLHLSLTQHVYLLWGESQRGVPPQTRLVVLLVYTVRTPGPGDVCLETKEYYKTQSKPKGKECRYGCR